MRFTDKQLTLIVGACKTAHTRHMRAFHKTDDKNHLNLATQYDAIRLKIYQAKYPDG